MTWFAWGIVFDLYFLTIISYLSGDRFLNMYVAFAYDSAAILKIASQPKYHSILLLLFRVFKFYCVEIISVDLTL